MRIDLLELELMRRHNFATSVKDEEARARCALINGSNKGAFGVSIDERHDALSEEVSVVKDWKTKGGTSL